MSPSLSKRLACFKKRLFRASLWPKSSFPHRLFKPTLVLDLKPHLGKLEYSVGQMHAIAIVRVAEQLQFISHKPLVLFEAKASRASKQKR